MQDELGLNVYGYEYRSYDPALGRWWQIDPVIKHHESPYAWVTNNPVNYFDVLGMDSTQRAQAVAKALEYVDKKPEGNSYKMSAKGQPGKKVDCSGLVSTSIEAGGETDPNHGERNYGTQNIVDNTDPVEENNDVEKGNLIFFDTVEGRENSHTGIVTNVVKDDDGNVVSVDFVHSGTSTGPTQKSVNMSGTGYWGERLSSTPFRKWDTKPDNPKTYQGQTLKPIVVKGQRIGSGRLEPIKPSF